MLRSDIAEVDTNFVYRNSLTIFHRLCAINNIRAAENTFFVNNFNPHIAKISFVFFVVFLKKKYQTILVSAETLMELSHAQA